MKYEKAYCDMIRNLRRYREAIPMSSCALSRKLGKSDNYIAKAESYDFAIPVETLLRILEILDVKPQVFFASDAPQTPRDLAAMRQIENASEDERAVLAATLAYLRSVKPC